MYWTFKWSKTFAVSETLLLAFWCASLPFATAKITPSIKYFRSQDNFVHFFKSWSMFKDIEANMCLHRIFAFCQFIYVWLENMVL